MPTSTEQVLHPESTASVGPAAAADAPEAAAPLSYSGPSDYETAQRTQELRNRLRQHELNQAEARHNMTRGALWCVGGLLVTGLTFTLADEGGSYFLAWGPVIFGGVQFFKGVAQYTRSV